MFVLTTKSSPGDELPVSKVWVVFLLAMLVTCVTRYHFYPRPPHEDRDIAMYSVMAHELSTGRELYSDLFEHKLPGMFWIYWMGEQLFGYNPNSILFVSLLFAVLGLGGVYYAAAAGPGGRTAGAWAMVLWAIISSDILLEANQPNAELFLNALVVWAFGVFLRLKQDRIYLRRSLAFGALMAGTFEIKHFVVILVPILFVLRAWEVRRNFSEVKNLVFQFFLTLVPIGLMAFGTILYFVATGRGQAMYEAIIGFNRFYSGNMALNLLRSFEPAHLFSLHFKRPHLIPTLPLLIVSFPIVVILLRRERVTSYLEWLGFVVFAILANGFPGYWQAHYQQYWLPPMVIGAAWAIRSIRPLGLQKIGGVGLVLVMILTQARYYFPHPASEDWRGAGDPIAGPIESTGLAIRARLAEGEKFFAWSNEPGLYFFSQRSPATGHLWCDKLDRGPYQEKFRQRVYEDLVEKRPRLIVVEPAACKLETFPEFQALLKREYRAEPPQDRFTLYWRKSGTT